MARRYKPVFAPLFSSNQKSLPLHAHGWLPRLLGSLLQQTSLSTVVTQNAPAPWHSFLKFNFIISFGPCWVFAVARILSPVAGSGTSNYRAWASLPCGMWDLSFLTTDWTCLSCIGRQILNHWTTREIPCSLASFLLKKFNWRMIALPCCVGFCHITAQISHDYIYVPSLLSLPPNPYTTSLSHHRRHTGLPVLYSSFPLLVVQLFSIAQIVIKQNTFYFFFHLPSLSCYERQVPWGLTVSPFVSLLQSQHPE